MVRPAAPCPVGDLTPHPTPTHSYRPPRSTLQADPPILSSPPRPSTIREFPRTFQGSKVLMGVEMGDKHPATVS